MSRWEASGIIVSLEQMCYNTSTTDAIGYKPIATQKNISYHYLSPARLLLRRWYFVIGRLAGLCFWSGDMHRKTTKEFIKQAQQVHGDKYKYDLVQYESSHKKVIITCQVHGEFLKRPSDHIFSRQGCPICGYSRRFLSQDEFLGKCYRVHGNRYDYSKTIYKGMYKKVIVTCLIHGDFEQRAHDHENSYGCPSCGGTKRITTTDFIERSVKVHGNRFIYDKVNYINSDMKVEIICKAHGSFWQLPFHHLYGHGCVKCMADDNSYTTDEFIKKAKKVHGNYYDYSKVNYTRQSEMVIIVCLKHGEFRQIAEYHLIGIGCPLCHQSSGERKVSGFLDSLGVFFERGKRFELCRNIDMLPFDFYFALGNKQFLIEYDGKQHFESIDYFGGDEKLKDTQMRDRIKDNFALKYGFVLIRIPYYIKDITGFLYEKLQEALGYEPEQLLSLPEVNSYKAIIPLKGWQIKLL